MVCSASVLSSTLALSLLRHSSSPSESFILSPFSLNTALSIIHDGATGDSQKELTNLLLNGCTSDDVTNHYSSLALSLPSNQSTGVAFKVANRFYVDNSISLKPEFQKHGEDKYNVKMVGISFGDSIAAAKQMNDFVSEATNGKIRDVIKADGLAGKKAILINAIHFLGKWLHAFSERDTWENPFYGVEGDRTMKFMRRKGWHNFNVTNDVGTVLLFPYRDENYRFFFLMPNETTTLEQTRKDLTGAKLLELIKNTKNKQCHVTVPKFKVESKVGGTAVLTKLGVSKIFGGQAELSKISDAPLTISNISQKALIEVDEEGTEAAAVTEEDVQFNSGSFRPPLKIVIDRPFLYGILRNEDIILIGQLV